MTQNNQIKVQLLIIGEKVARKENNKERIKPLKKIL